MARTRTEWAEERLRTAIITGELAPGQRLRLEQLAADWRMSPTPLREAVRGLAQSGLVVLSPQRGASVAGLSPQDVAEVYELRLLLEPRALRLSLHRRDAAWRAGVEDAWAALRRTWDDEDLVAADVEPAHTAFHHALAAACPNAELLRLTRRLNAQSMRILLSAVAQHGAEGPTLAQHVALHDACVEGEVDDAMRVALEHITRSIGVTSGPAALAAIGERLAQGGGADPLLPEVLAARR
jgi:GntR family transcriptional regulator, carbon starvation induced regulator